MKRVRPDYITAEAFELFEQYADNKGIGELIDDFEPWLVCWMDGHVKARIMYDRKYNYLMKQEQILNALQAAGVDNWEGYEDAIESLPKEDSEAGNEFD